MAGSDAYPLTGENLRGMERNQYVRHLFGQIAPRYNFMNRLMTGGLDQRWRRIAVLEAKLPPGGLLLDLATGTGDVALMALKHDPSLRVVGADFSIEMMRIGQHQALGRQVRWCGVDALRVPFPDNTFDAVISAYLIRNLSLEQIEAAFREQARLVKSGGRVVCLDATPPPDTLLKPLISFYLNAVIPFMGRLLAGSRDAYTYLPKSTQAFKTPDELAALMTSAGLVQVYHQRLMMGVMSLLTGLKAK
ncbi:MAG: ubiquinone/menaquinone biosynthesis methyltransferase [Anaerolineae bacterium]|nr:ubiquinone/menaquinone biosynthesis methyltransferase [Anaerolineae bacterium]